MKELRKISMHSGGFEGEIPSELFTLTNLRYRDLEGQNLEMDTGLPSEFGLLTDLEVLSLGSMAFAGTIPMPILTQLTNLKRLDVYYVDLNGAFPTEVGLLTALTYLDLSSNDLTGTFLFCSICSREAQSTDTHQLTNFVFM